MKKLLLFLMISLVFVACKNKKAKLTDDDTIEIADFIDFFPDLKLPYQLSDSLLRKKENDSSFISYKIFTQFVPDSVISRRFGKAKPRIYPLGKVAVKNGETYVFVKATTPDIKSGYIIAFDKQKNFLTSFAPVSSDKDPTTSQSAGMDSKYSLTVTNQKKSEDGLMVETKNVYILNSDARMFTLILTDAAVPQEKQEVINPIDTFPRRNALAGDYIKDKRNYVSIRDGRNASEILFFTHFEKENGECTGELKGTATLNSAKTALFRASGNPCVLQFTFSGSSVSLKEVEACGSYRDIKCFFDDRYSKKKEVKLKKTARGK